MGKRAVRTRDVGVDDAQVGVLYVHNVRPCTGLMPDIWVTSPDLYLACLARFFGLQLMGKSWRH